MNTVAEDRIVRQLSQGGYRITRPRLAVIRALLEDDGHLSPSEVRERASAHHPNVGLVTVYRTLDLLDQMGFVRRIHADHHHLICRHCGATVEFDGCDLSPFLDRVGRETGYAIEDHLLELVGVCSTCQ
jgi:Fur family ferric uptake transcriptional regulator